MRKLILFIALFAFGFYTMAQERFTPFAHHLTKVEGKFQIPQKVYGKVLSDTLWYEDFDSLTFATTSDSFIPAAQNFPTGWSSVDVSCAWNQNWRWDNRGPRGIFTSPGDDCHEPLMGVMNSPTKENGWMTLEAGYFHMAADCSEYFMDCMDTYLEFNGGIDFSEMSVIHLSYYQWSRFCCGYGSDSDAWFAVSVDEGATWNRISVHQNVINAQFLDNVEIDISSLVAGESNVWFRFHLEGLSHYHWEIDDVVFGIPVENDIRILDYWNDYMVYNNEIESTNDFKEGFYAYPWFLIQPFKGFHAVLNNFGIEIQNNVVHNVEIERNNWVEDYFNSEGIESFLPDMIDTSNIAANWMPENKGLYTFKHYIDANQEELYTQNDTLYSSLLITDSVLSVINFDSINNNISPHHFTSQFESGGGLGFLVNIPDPELHSENENSFFILNGITFYLDGTSLPEEIEFLELGSAKAIARFHKFDTIENSLELIIESSEHELTIEDTMSNIYVPFNKNNENEFLNEGGLYIVSLHFIGEYMENLCCYYTWTIGEYYKDIDKYSQEMCISFDYQLITPDDFTFVNNKPAIALSISYSEPYVGSEDNIERNFSIYPNPSGGLITIETNEKSEISIQNMSGQTCFTAKIKSTQQINVSHLPQGVYVVNINSKNQKTSEILVLQ